MNAEKLCIIVPSKGLPKILFHRMKSLILPMEENITKEAWKWGEIGKNKQVLLGKGKYPREFIEVCL